MKDKVYLIGVGMGNPKTLTAEGLEAIQRCTLLLGAASLVEPWRKQRRTQAVVRREEISAAVAPEDGPVGVLFSGDSGFFSGAARLRPLITKREVVTLPGISSLSYFCAKLGFPWQDVFVVSAHGRRHNAPGEIQCHPWTFVLTGGATHAQDVCAALCERGFGQVQVWVGERLSYPEERIVSGTAEELAKESFSDLAVLLAHNETTVEPLWNTPGLPDGAFQRDRVPMTKGEVRALAVCKLRLERSSVIWDVGAGTGSVAVECALAAPAGQVFAIERSKAACELVAENRTRFGAHNLTIIEGSAPEALEDLPAPDRVFIGGSGGQLAAILDIALRKNPAVRVVCTAVTLETVGEAARLFAPLTGTEMVQLAATRTRTAGEYHLMDAQNPVWLFVGEGRPHA